jgi:hypothetical protein
VKSPTDGCWSASASCRNPSLQAIRGGPLNGARREAFVALRPAKSCCVCPSARVERPQHCHIAAEIPHQMNNSNLPVCAHCGAAFKRRRKTAIYCSSTCREKVNTLRAAMSRSLRPFPTWADSVVAKVEKLSAVKIYVESGRDETVARPQCGLGAIATSPIVRQTVDVNKTSVGAGNTKSLWSQTSPDV